MGNDIFEFLEMLKAEHRDEKSLKAIRLIEKEIQSKKYGLVWEEHEETADVRMRTHVPVFSEVAEYELREDTESKMHHLLLEGDNLHSLRLLEKTQKGKIDVIYIDPPYNTGNKDFLYNDVYIEKDDAFRHSAWLSFMAKRLRIAHELLGPDGVMFLSIDDNEQAQLKLLMDEIFGEENFVICMPRITKKSGKTTTAYAKNHDYILVYTKKAQDVFVMEEHVDSAFKYEDEYVKERGKYKLNQTLDYDSLSYSASLDYPLEIEGEIFYPGSDKAKWEERQKGNHKRADWEWRWSKKLFDFGYRNGFIVIKRKKDGSARIYTKTYLNAKIAKDENGEFYIKYTKRVKATSSIAFVENRFSNDNAKKDLDKFGLRDAFDYSKPVELIKTLLRAYYKKDAVVLDFFAGSGTTGQAVLELNKEDGGTRRFLLCTNNENGICEQVTYSRLKAVMTGRCADGTVYEERIPGNMKYYRTEGEVEMLVLVYRKCSTCIKALKWLEENSIAFEERPIVEQNPTYEELKTWYKKSGLPLKKFFNTSGLVYKDMNLKEKLPQMSEEEQLRLLATNGKLVKRPLVIGDDFVLTGFKESEWGEKIKK